MNYKNKQWLFFQYYNNKLSIRKISELCNVTYTTIEYWMKKFKFKRRTMGFAIHLAKNNHCNLSKNIIEWINGELLGDGSLTSFNNLSARFDYVSKYEEYINYISETLSKAEIIKIGKIRPRRNAPQGNIYYFYSSKLYPELKVLKNKWYPNGKKKIPLDLELTPLILRQHYIGDGCLDNKRRKPVIRLCTCGFDIKDIDILCKKLNNLGFKAKRQPSNNSIALSVHSTKKFLEYIGPCPVKCYQYKWGG